MHHQVKVLNYRTRRDSVDENVNTIRNHFELVIITKLRLNEENKNRPLFWEKLMFFFFHISELFVTITDNRYNIVAK